MAILTVLIITSHSCYITIVSLYAQGFPGDFGERGPPGPDGNPVSEVISIKGLLSILVECISSFTTLHLAEIWPDFRLKAAFLS